MRVQSVFVIAATLLALRTGRAATQPSPDSLTSLDSFTARIEGLAFTEAPFTCRSGQRPRTSVDAEALIRQYLRTRGLTDGPAARAFSLMRSSTISVGRRRRGSNGWFSDERKSLSVLW